MIPIQQKKKQPVIEPDKKISQAEFLSTKRVLQQFQIDRLSSDYHALMRDPQWGELWNYFINDIYCPKDFTERNSEFKRFTAIFKSSLGKKVFRDLVLLLDLHKLTDELDNQLVAKLMEIGVENKISPSVYERAYRLCDNYDERLKQLHMIIESIHNTHKISSHWYIGLLIKSAKLMAGLLVPNSLLNSLENGYSILRNVKDIHGFTDQLFNKELARLNRIYQK